MNQEKFEMEDTVFAKIIRKEIPAEYVFESESLIAIRDIAPVAPVHVLIIPKEPIRDVSQAKNHHQALLGEMILAATAIAREEKIDESGYRLVLNCGEDAGLLVPHLHLHLIGGKQLPGLG